jgi:hypothetical protein
MKPHHLLLTFSLLLTSACSTTSLSRFIPGSDPIAGVQHELVSLSGVISHRDVLDWDQKSLEEKRDILEEARSVMSPEYHDRLDREIAGYTERIRLRDTKPPVVAEGDPVDVGDLAGVRLLEAGGADIATWPVTANLEARVEGGKIILDYDKATVWPAHDSVKARDGTPMNANPWVIAEIDGERVAATFEWFKVGQIDKPLSTVSSKGGHINQREFRGWELKPGMEVSFFVTTMARNGERTSVQERSNVVTITIPRN